MRRLICCANQIETQYYNSKIITGKQTNERVSTELIFYLCYYDHHIVSDDEIKTIQDVGDKNLLNLSGQCFDISLESKIAVPRTKGESTSRRRVLRSLNLKREWIPNLGEIYLICVGSRKYDENNDKIKYCVLLVNCDFVCENKTELGKSHNIYF